MIVIHITHHIIHQVTIMVHRLIHQVMTMAHHRIIHPQTPQVTIHHHHQIQIGNIWQFLNHHTTSPTEIQL